MIVKLRPPRIDTRTIVQEVVCTRPTRPGCFDLCCEEIGSKAVINCTGHGGAGWTTLFGFINKAIEVTPVGKKIRVVGSGCMGLTAAIELKRRGFDVAGVVTKDLYDNASWRAAGYFALIKMEATNKEEILAHEMGIETFYTYQAIERGEHPYLSRECVRFLPSYCTENMETGIEKLIEMGVIPPKKRVTLDFNNGVRHPDYLEFMTYFMSTSLIMKELLKEVERLQIPIELKEIDSYEELKEEVIFNCSGMGARKLHKDELMKGVRGHLIMINDPSDLSHMDYMIYSLALQEGKEEYLYMFPKNFFVTPLFPHGHDSTVTLGGTFLPDVDKLSQEEQEELDQREFKRLLDRHMLFFYGKRSGL